MIAYTNNKWKQALELIDSCLHVRQQNYSWLKCQRNKCSPITFRETFLLLRSGLAKKQRVGNTPKVSCKAIRPLFNGSAKLLGELCYHWHIPTFHTVADVRSGFNWGVSFTAVNYSVCELTPQKINPRPYLANILTVTWVGFKPCLLP